MSLGFRNSPTPPAGEDAAHTANQPLTRLRRLLPGTSDAARARRRPGRSDSSQLALTNRRRGGRGRRGRRRLGRAALRALHRRHLVALALSRVVKRIETLTNNRTVRRRRQRDWWGAACAASVQRAARRDVTRRSGAHLLAEVFLALLAVQGGHCVLAQLALWRRHADSTCTRRAQPDSLGRRQGSRPARPRPAAQASSVAAAWASAPRFPARTRRRPPSPLSHHSPAPLRRRRRRRVCSSPRAGAVCQREGPSYSAGAAAPVSTRRAPRPTLPTPCVCRTAYNRLRTPLLSAARAHLLAALLGRAEGSVPRLEIRSCPRARGLFRARGPLRAGGGRRGPPGPPN